MADIKPLLHATKSLDQWVNTIPASSKRNSSYSCLHHENSHSHGCWKWPRKISIASGTAFKWAFFTKVLSFRYSFHWSGAQPLSRTSISVTPGFWCIWKVHLYKLTMKYISLLSVLRWYCHWPGQILWHRWYKIHSFLVRSPLVPDRHSFSGICLWKK